MLAEMLGRAVRTTAYREWMGWAQTCRPRAMWTLTLEELDQLPESKYRLMEELSPINLVDRDAPPTLLRYDRGLDAPHGIHHPLFGTAFKGQMDAVRARCDVVAAGKPVSGS